MANATCARCNGSGVIASVDGEAMDCPNCDGPESPAANIEQLELVPVPRCDYCGPTGWTIERWGRETHKCRCPERTDPYCQAHPNGDCALPKPRWNPKWPLTSLYGTTWEDAFGCSSDAVDESAGLKDTA